MGPRQLYARAAPHPPRRHRQVGALTWYVRLRCLCSHTCARVFAGLPDDVAYSCETSAHFFLHDVLARWELYSNEYALRRDTADLTSAEQVAQLSGWIVAQYPFAYYFSTAPKPVFSATATEQNDIPALVVQVWCALPPPPPYHPRLQSPGD